MADPKLILSPLSRVVEENGDSVDIGIFRLEHTGCNPEIVASDGCVTVWEVSFESDEAAFVEAMSAIKDEGMKSFFERGGGRVGCIESGRGAFIMGFGEKLTTMVIGKEPHWRCIPVAAQCRASNGNG